MSVKAIAALVLAAALAIGAYAGFRWYQGRQVAVHVKAADKLEVQQAAAGTQAVTHEQAAATLIPTIQADDFRIASDRQRLAKLQHPAPGLPSGPNQPAPAAQPVPAPVDLAPLDVAKDQLIADLNTANANLKAALAEMTAGDLARQAQVKDLQGEVAQLRAALAAMPKDLKWAAGPVYGVNNLGDTAKGVGVDRDFSVIRTGIEVTRNTYAIANRIGWEGRLSLKVRW